MTDLFHTPWIDPYNLIEQAAVQVLLRVTFKTIAWPHTQLFHSEKLL